MNNSIFPYPQISYFNPQKFQQFFLVLNRKKPEISHWLWDKKDFLFGKNLCFEVYRQDG